MIEVSWKDRIRNVSTSTLREASGWADIGDKMRELQLWWFGHLIHWGEDGLVRAVLKLGVHPYLGAGGEVGYGRVWDKMGPW